MEAEDKPNNKKQNDQRTDRVKRNDTLINTEIKTEMVCSCQKNEGRKC